jgi:DNA-binding IclR family transcriptional regulator
VADKKQPSEIRMLERGLSVLDFIAQAERPIDRRSIQIGLQLSRTAVTRIVDTFIAKGYLRETGGIGDISLSPSLLRFRAAYLQRFVMESAAKKRIAALAEQTQASVDIGVRVDLDMVLIQRVLAPRSTFVSRYDVGSRLSMATTATGRAYLAILPQYERDLLIDRLVMKCECEADQARIRMEQVLAKVRRTGYAVTFGALSPLLAAVSGALMGPDGEYYVITCVAEIGDFTETRILEVIAPALQECIRSIALETGGESYAAAN